MSIAKDVFKGIVVSLTTPFDSAGAFDADIMKRKVDFVLDAGIDGAFLATGSVGECFSLSEEERIEIWKCTLRYINGRVPFIAGTNHTSTQMACYLAERAEELGADAVLNLAPYYWPLDEEAIYKHYKAIREATKLPLLIYNNPGVTGVDLSICLLKRLAKLGNVGFKDCTTDIVKLEALIRELKDKVPILHGRNEFYAPYGYLMGADGFTSVTANWAPSIVKKLDDLQREGKFVDALVLRQQMITPLYESFAGLSVHQVIEAYKFVESLVGIPTGHARPPAYELEPERKERIRKVVETIGLKCVAKTPRS